MCGRFANVEPIDKLVREFLVDDVETSPRVSYNIPPGSRIMAVMKSGGRRALVDYQWGLVPSWAKDKNIGNKMINARAETVFEKPSFRGAAKSRRCILPASGFFEWKKDGKLKIPQYIRFRAGNSMGFAGLYEIWKAPDGVELKTCTIITTEANDLMAAIHNRMPAILSPDTQAVWLDMESPLDEIRSLLRPYPSDDMEFYAVSAIMNSPVNDSPQCIEPAIK
jgi:putative SOS response-associated peptidase YedK